MRKVVRRDLLKDLISQEITTEFVEVTYDNGIYIVKPKHLQCVQCGCKNESKLIIRNGVHVCSKCIRSEVK